ncbi:hypothetical protein ACLB2K_025845 [Fragaria x ananassa]
MESGDLPGQRFCPMEDELLMFYLQPKVNGLEVPGNEDLICEVDLYGDEDPWKIWKRFEATKANDLRMNKDLYFFTQKKKKTARSSRTSRTVGSGGTWKGQNRAEVYLVDENQKPTSTLLGLKKTYTYKNEGSVHHGRWIMYEYELDESQILHEKVNKNEYVLCLLRKNDVLPEKKRKRQEEDEMVEDYVVDDDGDNYNSEPMMMPQEKRQRLPSMQDEQEKFLVSDQQFLQPEPSSGYGQEAGAVPLPLEGEPLFLDDNMGLLTPPMLDEAELQQFFSGEFIQGGQIPLEEEPVDATQVFENCGQQQLEAEPQGPQPREENLGQQCQVKTFSANEIVDIGFDQAENMVQQMGSEALGEVDLYGGNGGDAIVGESWSMSFMESLMNDELPTTVEVGDSNAAYSDFGYNLVF